MNHLELVALKADIERVDVRADQTIHTSATAVGFAGRRLQNGFALAVGDSFGLSLALLGGIVIRYLIAGTGAVPEWGWILLPSVGVGGLLLGLLPGWGLGPVEELRRMILLLTAVFGLTSIVYALGDAATTSLLTLSATFLLATILIPYVRSRVKGILGQRGDWGVRAVVYGAGPVARQVIKQLHRERGLGYQPVAVLDDNPNSWGRTVEGVRVHGQTDHVVPDAPVAIVAMPTSGRARQMDLLESRLGHYRKVLVIPDLFEASSLWTRPRDLSGIVGLEISSDLTSAAARTTKRLTDLFVLFLTVPIWLPVFSVIYMAIWLTDYAHPLVSQVRIGRGGEEFRSWSFRTMTPDADEVLRDALENDENLRAEWETTFRLRNDPRITPVGWLIRRCSLEHLPQLLNVLRGEMSLVGPRPLPEYHREALPPRARQLRERVLPGVTGLWKVFAGCNEIASDDVEHWDPYYIHNWSIWLDLVVLGRTLSRVGSRS